MPALTSIQIGNDCFKSVSELKLIGLHALKSVVIRAKSFTKNGYIPNKSGMDPHRHFYLKDCEQLTELKIGCRSFADYSVCEIANVPSLEVIEMGKLDEWSCIFNFASLELKGDDNEMN